MPPSLDQLSNAENDLEQAVDSLSQRKRIIGTRLTLDEMLNPSEEDEIGESDHSFEGGDKDIVDQVRYEMAVKKGEIIEIEEDKPGDEPEEQVGIGEMMRLCEQVKLFSLRYGDPEVSLDLSQRLRRFRIHLRKKEMENVKQTTLERWFGDGALQQVT